MIFEFLMPVFVWSQKMLKQFELKQLFLEPKKVEKMEEEKNSLDSEIDVCDQILSAGFMSLFAFMVSHKPIT